MTTEAKKYPLQRTEAYHRKSQILSTTNTYNVDYKLILCLRKLADKHQLFPENNFEGRIEIDFTYYDPKQEDIFLNFNGTVHSVSINGKSTEIKYENRRIYLSHLHLIANSLNKAIILYSCKYDKSGQGLHHFVDPIDKREYLYTQFEPYECHLLFPVFDQPDIKAALTITIAGPDEWIMLGNEKLTCRWTLNEDTLTKDVDIKGLSHVHCLPKEDYDFLFKDVLEKNYYISAFATTPRISPYLFALCAGPYHCYENPYDYIVPLRIFVRQSLRYSGEPKQFFKITMTGMEWYKQLFGIAYPFTKYDQIYCPEYNFGAMENVGLVTYNEAYCWKEKPTLAQRTRFCITTLHELTHMWFGNLVTMVWWDDLWLNESFATFISYLCQSKTLSEEYETTWVDFNFAKNFAYSEDQKSITHPVFGDITDTDKSESHFDSIVYYKGSSFLKQMYYFIGEENFSNGLKEYFRTYKWTNTKFDNFVDTMAEQMKISSNNKQQGQQQEEFKFDLQNLCKRWLSLAGLNSLTCHWESDSDGKITKFNIIQTPCLEQHKNHQCHMFDILLIYDNTQIIKKIMVEALEQTEIKSLIGLNAPKAVLLNYNDWGYFKWIADKASFDYLKVNLFEKLTDPLSRQLFYKTLFDMTRDAVIPCTEFIDIIAKFLERETETEIISNVLRQMAGVVRHYLPHKLYITYAEKMFGLITNLCNIFIDNKVMLMTLVDFLIIFAAKEERVMQLKDWLVNGPSIIIQDNKKVDLPSSLLTQMRRFSICSKCHQLPSMSLEEKKAILDKEVERDKNSDTSEKQKCKCKAILPDSTIKEEMWDMFINKNESCSLYMMKAYMEGFAPISQMDLVQKYCEGKFFEDVLKIEKKDQFFIPAFVAWCGPSYYPTDSNIAKLEEIAMKTTSAVLKKELIETADDLRRFKKCQALCTQ